VCYKLLGRFEEEFIEVRRMRLEIYLACLAKFYYQDLVAFLDGNKKVRYYYFSLPFYFILFY